MQCVNETGALILIASFRNLLYETTCDGMTQTVMSHII